MLRRGAASGKILEPCEPSRGPATKGYLEAQNPLFRWSARKYSRIDKAAAVPMSCRRRGARVRIPVVIFEFQNVCKSLLVLFSFGQYHIECNLEKIGEISMVHRQSDGQPLRAESLICSSTCTQPSTSVVPKDLRACIRNE